MGTAIRMADVRFDVLTYGVGVHYLEKYHWILENKAKCVPRFHRDRLHASNCRLVYY